MIGFHWDPVCPFAWITSRWLTKVVDQRGDEVDWRFISLRILNKDKDYDTDFPPEYPRLHGAGLRMLRVAAAVRADQGREVMGPLYTRFGRSIWDRPPDEGDVPMPWLGTEEHVTGVLRAAGLDEGFVTHLEDESWDEEIAAETEGALERTGRDVGTPIITVGDDGPAFFGPVISRIPDDDEAVELWDAVTTLVRFGGFAELKRSLRELPQLRALGWEGGVGGEQDWQAGSVRQS